MLDKSRTEIFFKNHMDEAPHVQKKVSEFLSSNQINESLINKILLCIDELVTNVIHHAYVEPDGEHAVSLSCKVIDKSLIMMELRDDGAPFDPTSQEHGKVTGTIETQAIGGLGIHLVTALMDQVEYEREGDYNLLRIYKNI